MEDFISNNFNQITFILTVIAGVFAFIKWLDSRNLKIKNDRYQQYIQHIRSFAGCGSNISPAEQIASAWFLLEYEEYYKLTLKILDNDLIRVKSSDEWVKLSEEIIQEIKSKLFG